MVLQESPEKLLLGDGVVRAVISVGVIPFRTIREAGCWATELKRGISSAGRAPGLQPGGGRFEPGILHHVWRVRSFGLAFLM